MTTIILLTGISDTLIDFKTFTLNLGKKKFNPKSLHSTTSVFVKIVLSSDQVDRVSLKGYRQNSQETVPGEEKVNQLVNTNCNK